MNDIEMAINLLKTINQNMKVDHMTKDMWDGATEEETREYIEDFGLINLAVSALEKQICIPIKVTKPSSSMTYVTCLSCGKFLDDRAKDNYCYGCGQKLDWSVEQRD